MKRILYILAVLFVSILLVGGMLIAVLTSDKVSTAAVQAVTAEFSQSLGTQAQVGAIKYRFPARVSVHDVYIEDLAQDTLLYVGEIKVSFHPLALLRNEIQFSHVRLQDVTAKIYRLPDSTWNYAIIHLNKRSHKKKAHKDPFSSLLSVRDIRLQNIRVRYEDYQAHLAHANMDLNHFGAEALDAEIGDLAMQMTRRSVRTKPFVVESVKAHVVLNDSALTFPALNARLSHSRLDMSGIAIHFPAVDSLRLLRSAHDITFGMAFHEATIVPSDLAVFAPRVKGLSRPITLNGAVGGTLDSLHFDNIAVRYDGRTILEGNVSAVGLPDLNNPYLRANLKDIHTNAAQLQDFLSQLYGRPMRLPAEVHRLGDIHYRGLAEGHLHDLTLHGAFRTALGTITTDGSFKSDSLFDHMTYDARLVGRKFRFGRMIHYAPLGTMTLDFASKGSIDEGKVSGDIRAHIRALTHNGYTYEDLHINGRYTPQRYEGKFAITDPHLNLSFDGVVDLHDLNPEINFNLLCKHFDSAPLGIASLGSSLCTRFSMAVDLNGVETDKMNGYLVIDSLFLATSEDSVLMQQLKLFVDANEGLAKHIGLVSDYLHADLDGTFHYSDLAPAFQAMMHHYLPSAVAAPKKSWKPVEFTLRADGQRLRDIQRLYKAPITLSDHPTLRAEARLTDGKEPSIDMKFFAPGVRAGSTPVHDLTVTLQTIDTLRHKGAQGSGLTLNISAEAKKMRTFFSTMAFHDTLLTNLTLRQEAELDEELPEGWRELTPRELRRALRKEGLKSSERKRALLAAQRAGYYGGDIRLVTHFSKYKKKPLIDLHLLPGDIILKDSVYTLSDSRITYCAADTSVQIEHFEFEGNGQHIRADGLASRRTTDTLAVDLKKIDASYVMPFVLPVQTIMFNGLLTGRAHIASVLKRPNIDTQIHIDSMGLNNCWFGDAEVDLHIKDSLAFHADVHRGSKTVVDLNGKTLFDTKRWELDMQAHDVPLAFVNHWTSSVLQNLDGTATGHVVVGGWKGMTYVLLRAAAKNASLTLPWTGARYTIAHDTIVMDTTSIEFPQVHLTDQEGNKVDLDGAIYHNQFRNFALDLHVNAHNALIFDKEKRGEMLQGHVYAKGTVDVTGDENDLVVSADARTTRNSRFRLSVDNVSSANESHFIHFVEHPKEASKDSLIETDLDNIDNANWGKNANQAAVDTSAWHRAGRCLIKLNLDVNPMLQFQLVLGERNGDMIQANGTGALRLTYDTETGNVRLLGTYDIDRGTLSYTIANVIRKEFTVGEGSTIVFSGNPSDPQLDLTAKYKVTANLRDLFGQDADQLATTRSNIPVLTCLHLSGALSNPTISFSLEFPQSDQAIQQQVRQIINTDEMLMRQVIYLLVFGRFYTPDELTMSQSSTLNSTYSLLSSTVTGQINSWLSKLTDMVTLGVAIRTDGEGANSSQEYEAQFQLKPVDRLIINGNVGYRYNDVSNQPFFGDLDVEVLLTEDGQWRLKGYTHTVDKYSLRQASTIQGFGIMWKKDFNWPSVKKKDKSRKSANVNKDK